MLRKRFALLVIVLVSIAALVIIASSVLAQVRNKPGVQSAPPILPLDRSVLQGGPCPVRVFSLPSLQSLQRLGEELNLDEDQLRKTEELFKSAQQKIQQITQSGTQMSALVNELKADSTDATRVKTLATAIAKQEETILLIEVDTWTAFEKLLKPEQNSKFWENFSRRLPGARTQTQIPNEPTSLPPIPVPGQ
ncbi:MAG: hypothetical protein QHH26_02610 [Armatimonadota bacterium]|nr:hypothetical protein [Armatimonadota bacterium]